MTLPDFALETDDELKAAVRDATSYDDTQDELPSTQLDGLLDDAKREMYGRTGSQQWYTDVNYGQALKAWTCIVVKAAVENINIESYSIADESISLSNADPDDSQQIQLWMNQVSRALDQAEDAGFERSQDLSFSNTSAYIG
jgi:hypothetical protein